jgi:predicted nucleic acid-binding protein
MSPSQPDIIISDTDVLSAFIKIEHFDMLLSLFNIETIYITPAVLHELNQSPATLLPLAVQNLITFNRLQVVSLSEGEVGFSDSLPNSLGSGERQTMAYARFHDATVISNESRVAHWCAQFNVNCIRLPSILRLLWQTQLLTIDEVKGVIQLLQERDRMIFSKSSLTAIFDNQE